MSTELEQQLRRACEKGYVDEVKELLLNHEIDINHNDPTNPPYGTPLRIASTCGREEVVKLLLDDPRIDVNATNWEGRTAFYLACERGRLNVVKILLKDLRIEVGKVSNDGTTPLYAAAIKGHLEVVEWLLSSGRDVNIKAINKNGKTLLESLKVKGKEARESSIGDDNLKKKSIIIKTLERFEHNPEKMKKKLREKITFPEYAWEVSFKNLQRISELIKEPNVDINLCDDGLSPFQIACNQWSVQIMRELLKHPDIRISKFKLPSGQHPLNDFLFVAELIKKNVHLEELEIKDCGLTTEGAELIIGALLWNSKNDNTTIVRIDIDNVQLNSFQGLESIPNEVLKTGTQSICQYILQLYRTPNSKRRYKTKLIVLGDEGVGKTCLIDNLFPFEGTLKIKRKMRKTYYKAKIQGNVLIIQENGKNEKHYVLNETFSGIQEVHEKKIVLKSTQTDDLRLSFSSNGEKEEWTQRLRKAMSTNSHEKGAINIRDVAVDHPSLNSQKGTKKIEISIWDFSGNPKYYSIQSLFISIRSVFLVTWRMDKGDKGLKSLNFWFNSLSAHLPPHPDDEQGKPFYSIIVVGAFEDLDGEGIQEKTQLREKIQQIAKENRINFPIQFFQVSSKTLSNIEELRESILLTSLYHSYMGERIPTSFTSIEKEIIRLRKIHKEFPVIEINQLIEGCLFSPNINDLTPDLIRSSLSTFHGSGECIYFSTPEALNNIIILSPEFLIQDILSPLVSYQGVSETGIVQHCDLIDIWPNHRDFVPTIISLLKKYQFLFWVQQVDDFYNQYSIIPYFLPKTELHNFVRYWPLQLPENQIEHEFIIKFNVLIPDLISRLFVQLGTYLYEEMIWGTGGLFKIENVLVYLVVEYSENQIKFIIRGDDHVQQDNTSLQKLFEENIQIVSTSFQGVVWFQK